MSVSTNKHPNTMTENAKAKKHRNLTSCAFFWDTYVGKVWDTYVGWEQGFHEPTIRKVLSCGRNGHTAPLQTQESST